MKYLFSLFLLVGFWQPLYSYSYIDSLDAIIDQKIAALAKSSYRVEKIVNKIQAHIASQGSLQEIENFLDNIHAIDFLSCNEIQLNLDDQYSTETIFVQQSLQDLQCALDAQLYIYYLECAQQQMLYKAAKNYEALNFWNNEKFSEAQSFYQKNILRYLSSAQYKEKIENNIKLLEKITQQTNAFLGLIIHNQKLLQKAINQKEFEINLIQAAQLQDDFLHVPDQNYDSCDMIPILKKSMSQLHQFSLYLSAQHAQCQLPSHVVRHWQGYTLTTVAACACAFIYLRYGEDLSQGAQYFWEEQMQGPVNRTINVLSGYAQAPQVDTAKHKERIRELVEAGVLKSPARGDETPLHDALADDCDEVSNGEFTQAYQKIDKKMEEVDDMVEKIKPVIGTAADQNKKFVDHGEEHPNEIWIDKVTTYSWFDPVNKDKYQKGSRDWFNSTPWRRWLWREDLSKPIDSQVSESQPQQPVIQQELPQGPVDVNADQPDRAVQSEPNQEQELASEDQLVQPAAEQESLQEALHSATGDLGQSIQSRSRRVQAQAPDTTDWTFEQKKRYYEDQLNIIKANPYKNVLRLGEPVDYKIEDESIQSKEVGNAFAKDAHMILSLTALIPVITVVGGSLFASKTLYNSVAYQPIRTLVRRLEILLNEAFYQEVSFEREGHIYFLTGQLKMNIGVLTIPEQKLIVADIEALRSEDLDYVQKFNVIQRMYRTYPCLVAGTI